MLKLWLVGTIYVLLYTNLSSQLMVVIYACIHMTCKQMRELTVITKHFSSEHLMEGYHINMWHLTPSMYFLYCFSTRQFITWQHIHNATTMYECMSLHMCYSYHEAFLTHSVTYSWCSQPCSMLIHNQTDSDSPVH